MTAKPAVSQREDRVAAALRENLRKRKRQQQERNPSPEQGEEQDKA